MKYLFAILLYLPLTGFAATLKPDAIVLLQPDVSIREKEPNAIEVSNYINASRKAVEESIKTTKLKKTSGFLVFAVREGNLSNAWTDFSPALPKEVELQIIAAIKSVPPFKVKKGTLVFALKVSINNARLSESPMPYPAAWREAINGSEGPMEIEALVNKVWP